MITEVAREHLHAVIVSFARVALLVCVLCGQAFAYEFTLTSQEWVTWPGYCKAKYVQTQFGERSAFRRRVSAEDIARWKEALGYDTWNNIHHGCAGYLWVQRAGRLRGKDPQAFRVAVDQAFQELNYSILRTPSENPVYTQLVLSAALLEHHQGKIESSVQTFENLMRGSASDSPAIYATYATVLFKQKDFARAREVLELGLEKVETPSAELHYFLGLTLMRLGLPADARVHAEKAYELGYPLPGLRNQLKAAGHWGS